MDCNDDECNPWKRKDKDKFDEFFGKGIGLDEMVKRMFGEFGDFDDLFRNEGLTEGQPYVRGFAIRMGPEGEPEIREFGNTCGVSTDGFEGHGVHEEEEQETLVDVMKGDEEVHVIADMPGVSKEDIDVNASTTSVKITAEGGNRKYSEKVDLDCEVYPETSKARYNNGVLEVTLKRKEPKEEEGEQTKVEVE
ncbi:MAG: archaeal heat shock protein Hsp20 [Archaeoglobaceae archaeon]